MPKPVSPAELWARYGRLVDLYTEKYNLSEDQHQDLAVLMLELCERQANTPLRKQLSAFFHTRLRRWCESGCGISKRAARWEQEYLVVAEDALAEACCNQELHAALNSCLAEALTEEMQQLAPKERAVLCLRFGLIDGHPWTEDEVARFVCLTRSQVHSMEAYTLRRMRHPHIARKLRPYLDIYTFA